MSERRDDTPKESESSPPNDERPRGSYYYDDATGYELYDPSQDDEEDEEEAERDARHAAGGLPAARLKEGR